LEKEVKMVRKIKIAGGGGIAPAIKTSSAAVEMVYKKRLHEVQSGGGIFPLAAPGLPPLPPNSAFLRHVLELGDNESKLVEETITNADGEKTKAKRLEYSKKLMELVRSALRISPFTLEVEVGPHQYKEAEFVLGHLLGASAATGPVPADVMIIGRNPWVEEVSKERCMVGADGQLLRDTFSKLKAFDLNKFYVTNLVKFRPPDWKTTLKAVWIKDCMHLLYQELKIVQPKYILCLGADVSKALLGGTAGVGEMEGRVEKIRYNTAFTAKDQEQYWKEAQVMTVVHPKQVLRDQSAGRQLENGISRFIALTKGVTIGATEVVDHRVVDNHWDLLQQLISIENDENKRDSVIAVDAEWHGQHPINKNAYMRTMQISWYEKKALGIKFHEAGGEMTPGFASDKPRQLSAKTLKLLNMFFLGGVFKYKDAEEVKEIRFRRKRVIGHFFNADLEWLVDYGINIQECFSCHLYDYEMKPENASKKLFKAYQGEGFKEEEIVPAWYRTKFEGGADTGLMAHAIEETASYKLETLAMRYTTAPRYDRELQQWKVSYCKSKGIVNADLEGYGECPDEILLPYGMYDADVTLRLFYKLSVLLDEDYEGNSCREAFWESQIATPAVLEIHRTGITVDRDRIDFLTKRFMEAKNALESKIRLETKWPDFNIRSTQHVRELLYGHRLNGKKDKKTGEEIRLRPPDAYSMQLEPLFDTSKPPKPWGDVKRSGRESEHSPSTNKMILSLLAQSTTSEGKAKLINQLRDYRFLDQVLKTVLHPPACDSATEEAMYDDDGNLEYDDGLASLCCDDGKVRTHVYQTKETGRWSSARPNLQNISKQRDPDYKRLLGEENYKYSLRSVLKASPGHVLVEADYVGAELFGMAVMSGDENMIKHALRNQLPENHPDYYDIHSQVACFAFKLKCPPTKSGLAAIGKKHIRIVAKSVIFGIAYGRGPKAIAIAAKEQGIDIEVDEARAVIDAIFLMYPRLNPFFTECKERATGRYRDPATKEIVPGRYLCNCYGRFRRFPEANSDMALAGEFERQAMNYPIQSMIASAVSRALAYIHDYKEKQRKQGRDLFKVLLQIHDAVLLEVPYEHVRHVCEYVLPTFMRQAVPIYPSSLDGLPTGAGPYYLGIEMEVMKHWGEVLTAKEARELDLPVGVGGVQSCVVNYSKPD
jgi:uracil-DNA glycosylase family 4